MNVLQAPSVASGIPVITTPVSSQAGPQQSAAAAAGSKSSSKHQESDGSGPTSTGAAASSSNGTASGSHALPEELMRLADATAPVVLPPPGSVPAGSLDNRELDKLVGTLGRNKATWRRALVLSQWLQDSGHVLDDRLCTTVSSCAGKQA